MHQYESLLRCHYNHTFFSLGPYNPFPGIWVRPQSLHATTIGSKMEKLLQCHFTISNPTQMRVDGGVNCHDLWGKHLFYILFVRLTPVQVSGVSTFSALRVSLIPVDFPCSQTLYSLDPYWCTPTYLINTLSLSPLNMYSGFLGASHESFSSWTFCDSQGHNFTAKTTSINSLNYININVFNNYQSYPNDPHRLL